MSWRRRQSEAFLNITNMYCGRCTCMLNGHQACIYNGQGTCTQKPEEKAKICSAYVDEYANMLVLVQVFRDLVKQAISLANLLGQAMENQILGNVIRHCKDFSDAQLMTVIKQFKEQQAVNSVFPEIRLALNTNFSIEETRTDARTNLSWIFL